LESKPSQNLGLPLLPLRQTLELEVPQDSSLKNTKWLLFKSKFEDIVIAGAGYDNTAQGHVLCDVVPKEAQERVEHVKLSSEMLKLLDKIYGDPATSVSIIVNKLLNLDWRASLTMIKFWSSEVYS
jgi:hypothetical protein